MIQLRHRKTSAEQAHAFFVYLDSHLLTLTLVLIVALAVPAQVLGVQAACNVKSGVDLAFQDTPSPVGGLYEAVARIESGEYEVVVEHRMRISTLLTTFADYLSGASTSVLDIYNAYDSAVLGILDSASQSTNTTGGQNAMRTVNQIGRLFAALPENVLDASIAGRTWVRGTYTRSEAFASNALRTQLLAARNLDILENSNSVAFASAVRWNSATDVEFSGYYTNHPGVSGISALPEGQSFWSRVAGTTQFTIDDPVAYTNWLRDHFYSNGALQIDPATGRPVGLTMTTPLSDTMWQRIRDGVTDPATGMGRVYDNRSTGLPGTHAEVQAANALSEGILPGNTNNPQISVHTVRSTRNPVCSGFECCAGCTDILRGWSRSTGGGGTLNNPFRRR